MVTVAAAADVGSPDVEPGDGSIAPPSIATSLPHRGDPGGIRSWLSGSGITYGLVYTSEALSNATGGLRRGTIFQDKLELQVTADFEKLAGWNGLSFYANGFRTDSTGGIGRTHVGGLLTISNIEALPSTRLSEIWLQQSLLGGKASLRFGQLTSDGEFFVSNYSALFINSDWPGITIHNLPSGGPAYPLSTPGVRLKVEPTTSTALLVALFNGDPAGPGPDEPQQRNRHGLNFRVQDPALLMAEAQYKYNHDKSAKGLAGTAKVGAWYHFGLFDHQRFGTDGLSLAHPTSSGTPARRRGNGGVYGVIDQQIYRPPGGGPDSGVAVFGRISASPSDRNLIDFYIDGGITLTGMIPSRPDDAFGVTLIYAGISDHVRALDQDGIALTGAPAPVRSYELTLDLTYQAQILPGWTVQPDVQFIIQPGGRVLHPHDPLRASAVANAAVFGLRSTLRY